MVSPSEVSPLKFERRPLRPGETDHEKIWLAVAAACALLGALWLRAKLPIPGCPFHRFTGLACPACGATRSVLALARLDFPAAFSLNPLVATLALAAALWLAYAALVVLFGLPRIRVVPATPGAARALRAGVWSLIAAQWAYAIWRLS